MTSIPMAPARAKNPFGLVAAAGGVTLLLWLSLASGCSFELPACELRNDCDRCNPRTAQSPIADDCGFFVSASAGDDAFDGTKARPVRTLARAIDLATSRTRHVYACAEEFPEAVNLPAGVTLFGGLDCAGGFAFPNDTRRTVITPGPDTIGVTVTAGAMTTRLENVSVRSPHAVLTGGSSIAVLALPEARLEIVHSDLQAGDGAPGADGANGDPAWVAAVSGIEGGQGSDACGTESVLGGKSPVLDCGAEVSIGGSGGEGGNEAAQSGEDGFPKPEVLASGIGGEGATDAIGCGAGSPGLDGARGIDGMGGSGRGSIGPAGYMGMRGEDGGMGLPGHGGGGGGGSRSGGMCMMAGNNQGAGGGAGGTGGCGGREALGGGFGGASVGIVSLFATVSLRATSITTGRGGEGGAGGAGQLGGSGGAGGKGGVESGIVSAGCAGGAGGRGGDGGHGGGGTGGPSIGVAFLGSTPMIESGVFVLGEAGGGGSAPIPESRGQDGVTAAILAFEEP
jgi:hypothetical protein